MPALDLRPSGVFPCTMHTLVSYVRLMRVHASITAVLGVLVVAVLLHASPVSTPVLMAALAVFLITGGGNGLNDCYDYEIDRINKPTRPIPSGALAVHAAMVFSWLLFGGGVAACLALNALCLAMAVVNTGLLVAYAKYAKQWGIGKNLLVAYLVGSVFMFTSLAVQKSTLLVAILGTCAFLATLAREIVKDIEDVEADRAWKARTVPITHGTPKARRVAFGLLGVSVAVALVPYALKMMPETSLWLILSGALIFAYGYRLNDAATSQKCIMTGSLVELCAFWVAKA